MWTLYFGEDHATPTVGTLIFGARVVVVALVAAVATAYMGRVFLWLTLQEDLRHYVSIVLTLVIAALCFAAVAALLDLIINAIYLFETRAMRRGSPPSQAHHARVATMPSSLGLPHRQPTTVDAPSRSTGDYPSDVYLADLEAFALRARNEALAEAIRIEHALATIHKEIFK